jgi:uncharacterized protein (DUF885 family)
MFRRYISLSILLLILISCLTTSAQNGSFSEPASSAKLTTIITHYEADRGNLSRFYVITNSPERRQRFKTFHEDYLKQLQQLDFDKMSTSDKVDYILLKRTLDNELRSLAIEENEFNQVRKYIPFADSIYQTEKLRRRGASLNAQSLAQSWTAIDIQVKQLTRQAKAEESMSKALSSRAEATVKGLQAAVKSVYDFYYGYDPEFTWWVAQPYRTLDSSLTAYASVLRNKVSKDEIVKDDGSGIIGNPIGRDELIRQLQYEMIPYSPEELVDIANKEFAWCEAEMLKASREMGFGSDWKKALEKVKNTYVPEGKQPEMIMGLYDQSVDFLKKHDLLTIPPLAEETWRMTMMTPERQLVAPFFLGGETLLISYPTNTMDHDAKLMSMRGNNPHFSRATVHHELIAGHGLQAFMNNRYKTYRRFGTPFWGEGWALYWEMILWDMKFPRSPEDRVGMLFWRSHRCARIIFSLNYHLGKWTPQQCIDFLVDRVGHERANAEGEVRRSFTGQYGPLYQLAYMMGALQFYALKKELVDSNKMSYKKFHDAILRENSIPVEMVRAILTNQQLTRDFKTRWRFY